jgi:predicted RNA-binding Zn-ribbon protein involved in translation (DUF1610 family)
MPDYFYSCSDCPEHTYTYDRRLGVGLKMIDHCEEYDRNFTKSWPMRNTPCRAMLEKAEHQCPVCGETMALYYSRKGSYFKCKQHGILQENGTVVSDPIMEAKE